MPGRPAMKTDCQTPAGAPRHPLVRGRTEVILRQLNVTNKDTGLTHVHEYEEREVFGWGFPVLSNSRIEIRPNFPGLDLAEASGWDKGCAGQRAELCSRGSARRRPLEIFPGRGGHTSSATTHMQARARQCFDHHLPEVLLPPHRAVEGSIAPITLERLGSHGSSTRRRGCSTWWAALVARRPTEHRVRRLLSSGLRGFASSGPRGAAERWWAGPKPPLVLMGRRGLAASFQPDQLCLPRSCGGEGSSRSPPPRCVERLHLGRAARTSSG